MTFEWHEEPGMRPDGTAWPVHVGVCGGFELRTCESIRGGYFWEASAESATQYRHVEGRSLALDDAKAAAEQMGRRMRKVLRWAR